MDPSAPITFFDSGSLLPPAALAALRAAGFDVKVVPGAKPPLAAGIEVGGTGPSADSQRWKEGGLSYQVLFERHPHPMWVFDTETLRFLAVNEAAIQFYGYSREEFLSMTIEDIRPPEDRSKLRAHLERSPEFRPSSLGYWRHLKKDRSLVRMQIAASSIHFGSREARLVQATDMTPISTTEEQLKLQSAALNAANSMVVVTDLSGHIEWANRAFETTTGYTLAEARGANPNELVKSGRQSEEFYRNMWQTIQSGGVWKGELINRRKDGSFYPEEMTITPMRDSEGRITHYVAVKQDITERKKLEEQLLRAQRMESIGTLAGGIAHDINNILSPILLSAELVRVHTDPVAIQRALDTIEASARRGADLVRQVLSFARGVEGQRILVNLNHISRELQRILQDIFPKNIQLEVGGQRDLWPVLADPTQLHQVLMNLCVNARDAMPNGGRLSLTLRNQMVDAIYAGSNPRFKVGPHVVIEVEDSGLGMSREVQERIFDPFYTTKEPGKGTGLGLSTVLSIVMAHGGFVNVRSEVGKGSTFQIYIPASQPEGTSEGDAAPELELPRGNGECVLVVDDEENIRGVACSILEAFGYRVLAAAHGAQAVQLYAQHPGDVAVVLLDMAMPVMDGSATCVALQSMDPQVVIIGTSGHTSPAEVSRALAMGIRRFLTKPYTAEVLLRTLGEVLADGR